MPATQKDIDRWYKNAYEMGASHIISICNGIDHDDYPVYVMPDEELEKYVQDINSQPTQSINEIINIEDKKTYKPRLENSDDVFDPWIETAKEKGAAYIISVCDTVIHEDYPVYVMPDEDLKKYTKDINSTPKRYVEEIIKIEYGAVNDKLDLENSRLSLRGEIDIRIRDLYFEKTHPGFGTKTLDELVKIIEVRTNEAFIEKLDVVINNLKEL